MSVPLAAGTIKKNGGYPAGSIGLRRVIFDPPSGVGSFGCQIAEIQEYFSVRSIRQEFDCKAIMSLSSKTILCSKTTLLQLNNATQNAEAKNILADVFQFSVITRHLIGKAYPDLRV